MPQQTPTPNKQSRSLGIALGVTEVLYLLGLVLLAVGIFFLFDFAWSLTTTGVLLLITAFYNDTH